MRIAIIPARGGSKRIPRKNLKNFRGKPIIFWPIEACLQSRLFDKVVVTTEDAEITDYARGLGVEVFARSPSLADDHSGTTEVIREVLQQRANEILDDDWLYELYPTSAVSGDLLADFVRVCESSEHKFLVGVSAFSHPIQRALSYLPDESLMFVDSANAKTRTQDLKTHFFDAGKLYGGMAGNWRMTESPLLDKPGAFILPRWAAVDIDYPEDWEFAEAVSKLPQK